MLKFISILIGLVVQWESSTSLTDNVELDEFQNVYVHDATTLEKFDKSGTHHFTFSTLRSGELTSLDVTNPLRLVLYFGENNEVLFLDNTLTEQGKTLNLNHLEYYDVGLVCSSFQNHLWVYRIAEQKLVRLSRNGEVTNETGNLALWLDRSNEERFFLLKETGNYLYLFSDSGLVMVFDHYGTFIRKIDLGVFNQVHVMEKFIFIKRNSNVYSMNVELIDEQLLYEIPEAYLNAQAIDFSAASLAVVMNTKVQLLKVSK
ncbi:MAG: hypothetical protein AB8B53_07540 [Flavobacteriales bacterium]